MSKSNASRGTRGADLDGALARAGCASLPAIHKQVLNEIELKGNASDYLAAERTFWHGSARRWR